MTFRDVADLALGGLIGFGTSTLFILVLFLGFCVLFGLSKLRPTAGGRFRIIRSLDERLSPDAGTRYLPADTPRGPIDLLRTPELIERGRVL